MFLLLWVNTQSYVKTVEYISLSVIPDDQFLFWFFVFSTIGSFITLETIPEMKYMFEVIIKRWGSYLLLNREEVSDVE